MIEGQWRRLVIQQQSAAKVVVQFAEVARASRPGITRKMRVPLQTAPLPKTHHAFDTGPLLA